MERSHGSFTDRAREYVDRIEKDLRDKSPREIGLRVRQIVAAHEEWRNCEAISLNASENILSRRARELLNSDLATRVTEGFPGDKDFPAHLQNRFIDEVEASIIHMLRRLFQAKYIEWRPVSTSMANATVFFALTEPGDIALAQPESAGGNYSYNPPGPPRAAHLDVRALPFLEETFEVDVDRAVRAIETVRPKIVAVGGSNVLFPYPVAELRAAADNVGAKLLYDAAHVALYIPTGMFQDPLGEGAHVLTFSSHKIMSGAIGGVILSNDNEIGELLLSYSFPTLIQTRDQNKYAATAHALAEMCEFGKKYAAQTVINARALAGALEAEGFKVLCRDRGYTQTHQIFALLPQNKISSLDELCQRANILVTRELRMTTRPAMRLTTQEITRRGMTECHMAVIAAWLRRIIKDDEEPSRIAVEVKQFLTDFRELRFSFDG
jgi:glycine hydroxymethyltransferase